MKSIRTASAMAVALSAALVACGGDSSGPGPASSVAGLYEGSGGANRASELLILDEGRYYLVYGLNSASAAPVGGVIVGSGSPSGDTFASSDAHNFDFQSNTLRTGTLKSTVAPKASASTSLVRSDGSGASFAGTFNGASDTDASLSALAGTYGGEITGLNAIDASVLSVDGTGILTGATSGSCSYAGLAQPHGRGQVFDVSLTFRTGCPNAGNTLRGHGFLSGKVLFAVVVSGDLGTVTLFSGLKP
jgi:hypothetical protein